MNIFKNVIYSCDKSWFFIIITPVLCQWSFWNHYNMLIWCLLLLFLCKQWYILDSLISKVEFIRNYNFCNIINVTFNQFRARFSKQGKLARACDSKTVPMDVDISAGDLLTTRKLKNRDTTSHFHNDQCNLPSAAQIILRICSDWDRVLLAFQINEYLWKKILCFYHALSVLCGASS